MLKKYLLDTHVWVWWNMQPGVIQTAGGIAPGNAAIPTYRVIPAKAGMPVPLRAHSGTIPKAKAK